MCRAESREEAITGIDIERDNDGALLPIARCSAVEIRRYTRSYEAVATICNEAGRDLGCFCLRAQATISPCDNYKLDMEAAQFGACKHCGFLKKEHQAR
jgi:hypothetical protein